MKHCTMLCAAAWLALAACGDEERTPATGTGATDATAPDAGGDTGGAPKDTGGAAPDAATDGAGEPGDADGGGRSPADGGAAGDTGGGPGDAGGSAGDAGDAGEDTAQAPELLPSIELEGEAWPESVAFDPLTRAFFTGSLALGNVLRIDAVTGAQAELDPGNGAEWLVLGLDVDAPRRRLWVCTVFGKTIDRGEIWAIDLDTGARALTVDLEDAAPGAACADVVIHSDGTVYVSDRQADRIYRIDPTAPAPLSVYVSDPQLAPEIIGQNGLVKSPNEHALLASKYLPQKLVRVDLTIPASPAVTTLDLDFGDLDGGADDLTVLGGRVYVIMEDRIAEVTFDDEEWTAGSVTRVIPALPKPDGSLVGGFSGLAVAEGHLYASRSDVLLFAFGSPNTEPFLLQRVEIPPL